MIFFVLSFTPPVPGAAIRGKNRARDATRNNYGCTKKHAGAFYAFSDRVPFYSPDRE
jgi:hypothetical protein